VRIGMRETAGRRRGKRSQRYAREAVLVELFKQDGRKGPAGASASAETRIWGPGRYGRALHEAPRGELVERRGRGRDFPAAA
jgi:hypothetical protein